MQTVWRRHGKILLALAAALAIWLCWRYAVSSGGETTAIPIDAEFVSREVEYEAI